ncbi:hypothetical protein [Pseudooceanicola sp. LIPI14-2-Ac024]|uniref:hypothetical protein n=1 Tax=Pseudooceanicola sp. LIPI14-2-Ac024 TaxID=3344875 RepID=UPI0035CFA885
MTRLTIPAAALAAAMVLPAAAQEFDPAKGVEPVAVLEDGRIMVRNGAMAFDCALEGEMLSDCQPRPATQEDAAAMLAAMSDEDWQALVEKTMRAADCRLSAFAGAGDVIAAAAAEKGASPEEVEGLRADMTARAEATVDRMMKAGQLSVRDGELVLYNCP